MLLSTSAIKCIWFRSIKSKFKFWWPSILVLTISVTKNWNRRMEQKAEELYEDGWHPRPQFSVDERVFMVLKYTETVNVLETIRRLKRQFRKRNVHCCRRSCSNVNHTGYTYCKCPLLFVCTVSSDSETAFETF